MTNPNPPNTLDEPNINPLTSLIRYRVTQEYQKYHNDASFEANGKDFWIDQIVWKLAEALREQPSPTKPDIELDEIKPCMCVDVELGSYDNQAVLKVPDTVMIRRNTPERERSDIVCVDSVSLS